MALKTYNPTSEGKRFHVSVDYSELSNEGPEKSLLRPLFKKGGRNNLGRMTVRHQGGGHKRRYRVIDFKRNQRFAQGGPRYTELLRQLPLSGKPRAGQEFADIDEFTYLVRNLLIKPARFRYFGLTIHMFSDVSCPQCLFGLTVAPSAKIRKKLLNYMNICSYYGSVFELVFRHRGGAINF